MGYKVSEETKTRTKMNIYMTNVPSEIIKSEDIFLAYSLRWQIEFIFEVWKSLCKIDKLKKVRIHRFERTLLSGLIWIMANWSVFMLLEKWLDVQDKIKSVSVWKYFKFMTKNHDWVRHIIFGNQEIDDWLFLLLKIAAKKLYKETKKGHIPHVLKLQKIMTP